MKDNFSTNKSIKEEQKLCRPESNSGISTLDSVSEMRTLLSHTRFGGSHVREAFTAF